MLADILEIVIDIIMGSLNRRIKNGSEWNFFGIFALIIMWCLILVCGYLYFGWLVFVLLAVIAAVTIPLVLLKKRKTKGTEE